MTQPVVEEEELVRRFDGTIGRLARERSIEGRLDADDIKSLGFLKIAEYLSYRRETNDLGDGDTFDAMVRTSIKMAVNDAMRAQVCESRDYRREVRDPTVMEGMHHHLDSEQIVMASDLLDRLQGRITDDEAAVLRIRLDQTAAYTYMEWRQDGGLAAEGIVIAAGVRKPPRTRLVMRPTQSDFAAALQIKSTQYITVWNSLKDKFSGLLKGGGVTRR